MPIRATLAALLCLAAVRPAHADPPQIAYSHFVLPNGLRVFVVEDHALPQVAVVTYYKVGSKDEVPGRTGFAHLFEHLMFKGSAHVPDGKMDTMIEEAGGWTNAFTSPDQTVYQDFSASSFLEPALWLEADRLAGLTETLDQAKLDNQREVVLNERRQRYENTPYGAAWLLLPAALWPRGHGYHWPTIGEIADLRAASLADVKSFFTTYYVPGNATLVIAGDVDPVKTRALVEKYLGWIPRGAEPKRPTYRPPAPIRKEIRLAARDDVQVPKVFFAWRAPAGYAAEHPAGEIALDVLGGGKSSRLYERLVFRERLAQDVEVYYDEGELASTAYLVITAKPGVDPEKLVTGASEEIARLAATPPTAAELERIKNATEASFLQQLEPIMARAIKLAMYDVLVRDPDFLAKDLARFRSVTDRQVADFAKKHLGRSQRAVLVISPEGGKK